MEPTTIKTIKSHISLVEVSSTDVWLPGMCYFPNFRIAWLSPPQPILTKRIPVAFSAFKTIPIPSLLTTVAPSCGTDLPECNMICPSTAGQTSEPGLLYPCYRYSISLKFSHQQIKSPEISSKDRMFHEQIVKLLTVLFLNIKGLSLTSAKQEPSHGLQAQGKLPTDDIWNTIHMIPNVCELGN